MSKDLVIVESPAKAKTIGRFLGSKYTVKPSLGHVRDLPNGKLGVAVEDGFKPQYVVPKDKKPLIKDLSKAVADAKTIYLATDPDREGEAIAWHLTHATNMGKKTIKRVVFHEITEPAINEAFDHPREINVDLVNAQQARRVVDRLVGYKLSPLLWKKIRGGLSAGRVQSAALRMVIDREREFQAFVPSEYWRIVADLSKTATNGTRKQSRFFATLTGISGDKRKLGLKTEDESSQVLKDLEGARYVVANLTKKESQRKPAPPFTTSTLQQEAWRKLRFSSQRTMRVAQELYEGLSLGSEGSVGLITYMRTDSPVVSPAAVEETRGFARKAYGKEYVPSSPRKYTARSKGAQEAHEAIRPTSIPRTPASIKQYLEPPQFRLYELIWKRLVASQMANALFDSTSLDVDASSPHGRNTYVFHANGSVQKFPGFLVLYSEGKDRDDEEEDDGALPPLEKGEALELLGLDPQQKFTQPPPRFTEASLIKAMEENGIGRPSTYAPTIAIILARGYVKKEGGALHGQSVGMLVNDLLSESYPSIIDSRFTARMEEELDEVARGEKEWVPVLESFYGPFERALATAIETLPKMQETTDAVCDDCGRPMVVKKSRFGLFLACTGYPECKTIKDHEAIEETTEEVCDACGRPMAVKKGRFGLFLACTGYPECKTTKPHQTKLDVKCPDCNDGDMVQKKSRKGRTFYSCSNYPSCKFATNLKPVPQPCPVCGKLLGEMARGGVKCAKCDFKGPGPGGPRKSQPAPELESVAAAT